MKAAVLHSVGNIKIEDVEQPAIKKGEVLMKVEAVRVCGTDVHFYKGEAAVPSFPLIMGHEAAGIVAEVGSEVTTVKPSTRILMDPIFSCGRCYLCKMALDNLCENGGLIGRESNGAYAEYVAIPEELALPIPDSISYEEASFLEPLSSVIHGQNKLEIHPGTSVVILGLGPIGMMHLQLAKLSGASPIIGITANPQQMELAKTLGADMVINASQEDTVARVKKAMLRGGADIVIEAAGVPQTIRSALELVRPAGQVLQYGLGPTSVDNINASLYIMKEITLFGVRATTKCEYDTAIRLVESKAIDIRSLISRQLPLEKLVEAFEAIHSQTENIVGIVINSFA